MNSVYEAENNVFPLLFILLSHQINRHLNRMKFLKNNYKKILTVL